MNSNSTDIDWLNDYIQFENKGEFSDILETYTLAFYQGDRDIELCADNTFIELPNKFSHIINDTIRPGSYPTHNSVFPNSTSDEEKEYFRNLLSYNLLFSKTCKSFLAETFKNYFSAHQSNSISPRDKFNELSLISALSRKIHVYATAMAIYCGIEQGSALADVHYRNEKVTSEFQIPDVGDSNKNKFRMAPAAFSSDFSNKFEILLDETEKSLRSKSGKKHNIVTSRDVLIGVWWVYWSMKNFRDSIVLSEEISFLWNVLTNRTPDNTAWLENIQGRCRFDYQTDNIQMLTLPKSNKHIRTIPHIPLGDKVALMALYASCYSNMERNDNISSDYSYKYPRSTKIESATCLNYVPRAFWYRYLSNYLNYKNAIKYHLDNGRYVFKTDIANFVQNVKPELLYDSMITQGYGEYVARTIYQFHRSWNDQDDRIGIPFGSSLTTAGMKIVICRINMEMNVRGFDKNTCFCYADDFAIVGFDLKDSLEKLKIFDDVLNSLGLERNFEKTHLYTPHDETEEVSVDSALKAAYAELHQSSLKSNNPKNVSFEFPESITSGGEVDPSIDFNSDLEQVPCSVIDILYVNHVEPLLDRGDMPDKGIAGYTLYRMLKSKMPESENAICKIYSIAPQMQSKILGWLSPSEELSKRIIIKLAEYYKSPDFSKKPWADYSRSIFVYTISRIFDYDQSFPDNILTTLLKDWWSDPETGYLTKKELQYLAGLFDFHSENYLR